MQLYAVNRIERFPMTLKIISAVESNIFSICSVQRDCQSNTVIANELTASFL